ncbi:Yos1-like [Dillenia turbinata]|uniref:Yos1-like n=1 Tax=Dillenia turbinata TaxID=194707 RepID=A0AAN8ZBB8_9MAGN
MRILTLDVVCPINHHLHHQLGAQNPREAVHHLDLIQERIIKLRALKSLNRVLHPLRELKFSFGIDFSINRGPGLRLLLLGSQFWKISLLFATVRQNNSPFIGQFKDLFLVVQGMGLWTLLEGFLLLANAFAILNEDRFLAPRGWVLAELPGGRGNLKGQIIGLIYATQYLRVPLIILNTICIIVKLLSG